MEITENATKVAIIMATYTFDPIFGANNEIIEQITIIRGINMR